MKELAVLVLIIFLHLFFLLILRFTAWPEMLSYPYLLSNGFQLYKDFIIPYPPGLIVALMSFFNMAGYTPQNLRILTWIIIISVDLLMYLILKRITPENKIAFFFLSLFIILQSLLDGNMLWFDFATVPPLLLVFFLSIKWLKQGSRKYLFWIGLLLSLAILVKQVALAYAFFFLIFAILHLRKKILSIFPTLIIGGLIPQIVFGGYLFMTSSFQEFWLWTIYYPLTQWSKFPSYVAMKISIIEIFLFALLFLPLMGIIWVRLIIKDRVFILSSFFFVAAILAVYPRVSLFHFQPALTFLVIMITLMYQYMQKNLKKIFLLLILFAEGTVINFIPKDLGNGIRFFDSYEKNISKEISSRVKNEETIFLLGLNSSQYAFTDTLPPKHWSDNFGWYLEIPGIQEWVLEGFYQKQPEYIFRKKPEEGNWYDLGSYQPQKILLYIRNNYNLEEAILQDIEVWKKKD